MGSSGIPTPKFPAVCYESVCCVTGLIRWTVLIITGSQVSVAWLKLALLHQIVRLTGDQSPNGKQICFVTACLSMGVLQQAVLDFVYYMGHVNVAHVRDYDVSSNYLLITDRSNLRSVELNLSFLDFVCNQRSIRLDTISTASVVSLNPKYCLEVQSCMSLS